MEASDAITKLKGMADLEIAKHSQRFFKTGKGEYGEGDVFLGIRVPNIRKVAKQFKDLSLNETETLLHSEFHEARLCALVVLVNKYKKADEQLKEEIYQLYLDNTAYVNNWDLVDASAHYIVGPHLFKQDRNILYQLAKSKNLWERRIAIMSTYHFIKNDDLEDTLIIAKQLLYDEEDLIHKAVGWMLRELGKKDQGKEEAFLEKHVADMPRTMLRYAIEKFSEEKRQYYLNK